MRPAASMTSASGSAAEVATNGRNDAIDDENISLIRVDRSDNAAVLDSVRMLRLSLS